MINLETKLPSVGETIFTTMSALAAEKQAINLSQGFPDYRGPEKLLQAVGEAVVAGNNQYAPLAGVPKLLEQIAVKVKSYYGRDLDIANEITVTPGATEAIYSAVSATVRAGDEVIVFDPAYDSYQPAIELNGGIPVHIQLLPPSFEVDWDQVRDAITPRTRMIIINTPHNPTGTIWKASDLDALAEVVRDTDILIISDEVYEHLVYDGQIHQSLNRHPELAARAFIVSSFGKTYHVTGWRTGYCVAPAALTKELRKVHQYVTFTSHTPIQHALASYMTEEPDYPRTLPAFFMQKRDRLANGLKDSGFKLLDSNGTYFQLVDYTAISDLPDDQFVLKLVDEIGVAAIPLSPFYANGQQTGCIRLCFAKADETIDKAVERLCKI